MDEIFSRFLEKNGPITKRQEPPPSSIQRFTGKLPERLLDYWIEHGWCACGNGLFWLVNPQEYEGVVASWIEGTDLEKQDTYHLIGRSAFGDLYLFGEKTGFSLTIDAAVSKYSFASHASALHDMDKEVQNFFLSIEKTYNDFDGLFTAAKKKLGILDCDEMYGFVPALAFGGPCDLDHLEKVKAVEHLLLLSQICPLEPYSFSDF